MADWGSVQAQVSPEQVSAVVEQAARALSGLPLAVLRNRRELGAAGRRRRCGMRCALHRGDDLADPAAGLIAQVAAKVGGLGFLDALMPAQLDRVHRPAGERRRPRVGPAQERRMQLRRFGVAAEQGRGLARRRGAAGA